MNPLTELTLADLRRRTSAKWTRYDADALPLWVAEMDVSLAPPVREALERAVRDGDTGYPGSAPLVEAFVSFAARRWGWEPDPADVAPVSSVIAGYVDALVLATDAGGEVVVNPPVYPPFFSYLREAGRVIREAPLGADMRLDLAALEAAFDAATAPPSAAGPRRRAGYLLCSPHNPGGAVHTREELTAVAALAERYGVAVVSDEVHAPLVYSDAEFTPYLSVPGGEAGMALHAASKAFNLAAMPAALLVAGPGARPWLAGYRAGTHHWPTHLGAISQAAAYAEGDPWLDALLAGLESNRTALEAGVAALPGLRVQRAEGTYLAWLDFRGVPAAGGRNLGHDPAHLLYSEGRLVLNPGPSFGTGGEGHARLNFATHPDVLSDALRRIGSVLG